MTSEAAKEGNPNCAETCASLQLFGDNLMPEEVSRLLRLPATESSPKGSRTNSPSGKTRVAPTGWWILETRGHVHSTNAEHHVKWLLDQLDTAGLVPSNIPGAQPRHHLLLLGLSHREWWAAVLSRPARPIGQLPFAARL